MNNDLQTAKTNLGEHALCLCKNGECIYGDKRGVSNMLELIDGGADLQGYAVADKVVGKAAAMLFAYCGIAAVHAKTLSDSAKKALERLGIPFEYETLTDRIINRDGTDMCPMEKSVWDIMDPALALEAIRRKKRELEGGDK